MEITKKPTRKELLQVITELQRLVSAARTHHGNDRDPNGFEKGQNKLTEAFELCVQARSFDPPTDWPPPKAHE